jgi:hypothetical protein
MATAPADRVGARRGQDVVTASAEPGGGTRERESGGAAVEQITEQQRPSAGPGGDAARSQRGAADERDDPVGVPDHGQAEPPDQHGDLGGDQAGSFGGVDRDERSGEGQAAVTMPTRLSRLRAPTKAGTAR